MEIRKPLKLNFKQELSHDKKHQEARGLETKNKKANKHRAGGVPLHSIQFLSLELANIINA